MAKKRIEYIDNAKGIGIILVVIGHIIWGKNYPIEEAKTICNFIYSFHMPLFFIICGLCIKDTKSLNGITFKKMVKNYIIPYLIWTIIYILIFQSISVVEGKKSFIDLNNTQFAHAITLCGIAPLWFLLALFISENVVLLVKNHLKGMKGLIFLILLACLTLLFSKYYSYIKPRNLIIKNYYMGLFRILPTTFFIYFGYYTKNYISHFVEFPRYRKFLICGMLLCFQIIMCIIWDESIDIQVFKVGNPLLYFIKAINGSLLIILISSMIHFKLLADLGEKTKEIMILHYKPFYWTSWARQLFDKLFSPNIFGLVMITIVTIAGCIILDTILKRIKIWRTIMGK